MEQQCPLCSQPVLPGQESATLTQKGCEGIQRASEARGIEIHTEPGQQVHRECRSVHCNPNYIESYRRKRTEGSPSSGQLGRSLRSLQIPFSYDTLCLFCGTADIYDGKKNDYRLIKVRTFDFQEKILDACLKRKDDWARKVKDRIDFVHDLHAADSVYHQACSINFRTGKQIPKKFQPGSSTHKRVKLGRPRDEEQAHAFTKVIDYLEKNDEEQTTIQDLIQKMSEHLDGTGIEGYSFTYMKEQIQANFGDKIIITEINGKPNVVTMWSTATTILQEFHSKQRQESPEEEKLRIIQTAAKLIKNDMKSLVQQKDCYPDYQEMASVDKAYSFLPASLRIFLQGLITPSDSMLKIASLGQALLQSARPRVVLSPLQLGVGVQLHHHFASKFLIDTLHKLGYCCSYNEIVKFERSAAVHSSIEIPDRSPDSFVQYVADNVDHNICTLDGHNTFHGMGIIATVTPGTTRSQNIPRITVTTEDILAVGRVNIEPFNLKQDDLQFLRYAKLQKPETEDPSAKLDLLWRASLCFGYPRPGWAGTMQLVHKGKHPGKSSILFLPIIDMNPNDLNCLYSTLLFVCRHASHYGVTPILTFDQPLWWKSITIQESSSASSEIRSIVLRLGGFHTEMSFLGAIGHIMAGTGLQEVLECVYASNTVSHMLSGKAISRAIRGHMLVCGALHAMIMCLIFGIPVPTTAASGESDASEDTVETESCDETTGPSSFQPEEILSDVTSLSNVPEILIAAGKHFNDLISGSSTLESLEDSEIVTEIERRLRTYRDSSKEYRTAKLWLLYLDMITILQTFIKAERTGNWPLHLKSMYDMIPYLAAAGHNNYTKSVYLYLQNMEQLQNQHPDVYKHFMEGKHVGRRSDRYWAGLSQDLLIEQVFMRSIKTTGGLTRGRGMSELQRLVWLLSTNACSAVNLAMQQFTSVGYMTSEQHKETTAPRQKKDMADTKKVLTFLSLRSPFQEESALRCIISGVNAETIVNADHARDIGERILKDMEGQCILKYSLKRKDQVVSLSSRTSVKIKEDVIHIDPQLLFQRLVTIGTRNDKLAEVFQYELCSYPTALFEDKSTMRLANKASLANEMWKLMPSDFPVPTGEIFHILDGGALIHRVPWKRGSTYDEICLQYLRYVSSHYGQPIIGFDGYMHGPSTKDSTQQRRSGKGFGRTVKFSGTMVFSGRKDEFLSNKENKQRFIYLLSGKLERQGCQIVHARADADLLIVQTSLVAAQKTSKPTVLVADDTDILILLCFLSNDSTQNVYLRPEPRQGVNKPSKCWKIALLRSILGPDVCRNVLFMHAVLGCDTTSHVYGLGKGLALKMMRTNPNFKKLAEEFNKPNNTKDAILAAGESALVALYKGQPGDKLDSLRLQQFQQKVRHCTSFVNPHVLPPTSAAAKYHSMRVYLQVQQWMGNAEKMNAEHRGWFVQSGMYAPLLTDRGAAPTELLEVVRCNCKMGCNTKQCSCRKHGLECSGGCGHCRGACSNLTLLEDNEQFDE